jgi:hypothetical protein
LAQSRSHFFRQANSRLQWAQGLVGRWWFGMVEVLVGRAWSGTSLVGCVACRVALQRRPHVLVRRRRGLWWCSEISSIWILR